MHKTMTDPLPLQQILAGAIAICEQKNVRFTKARQMIFELIVKAQVPVKAYDVLDSVKERDKSAKPPTVYRAIDFLMECGLIHKIHRLNAYVSCSHPSRHKECYFLICSKCNGLTECCSKEIDTVITDTAAKAGFSLRNVSMEMTGICQHCC